MKFTVKNAGEVEIQRDGDLLKLVNAQANDGWRVEEDEMTTEADTTAGEELEVTFVKDNREVEFEAEIEDGQLEIEISEKVKGVEPGTFQVGEAGDVEINVEGNKLVLVGVIANEGWDFETEHEDDDDESELEVEFVSGNRKAEFEAALEDGVLEVEIGTSEFVEEG